MTTYYGYFATVSGSISYVAGPIASSPSTPAIAFAAGAGLTLQYFPDPGEEPEYFIGQLDFDVDEDFSWELWLKTTQDPGAPVRLLEQASGGVFPYRLELVPGGALRLSRSDGTATASVDSSVAVNDDDWHYVVAYKAGASFGVAVDTGSPALTADTLTIDTTLTVDGAVAGNGFIGAIAELALYPSALTATQRSRHQAAATGTPVVA